MARTKGLLSLSGNFEPQLAEPFDARAIVGLRSDLMDPDVWKAKDGTIYVYVGMPVVVKGDGANSGMYWLKDPDYTLLSSWEKIGGSGGSASSYIKYIKVSTMSVTIPGSEHALTQFPSVDVYKNTTGSLVIPEIRINPLTYDVNILSHVDLNDHTIVIR